MGVFIGWSGKNTKSYRVAEALHGWIGQVIQGCEPWVSTQDIDAGQRWGTELFAQLDNHNVGIICVTKENQGEPWLNFEAGALVKQLKAEKLEESRVCPLLIGLTDRDVTGPLKLLQTMPLDKHGMFKVLQMVNKHGIQKPLSDEVLKKGFEKWWPDLEDELKKMDVPEQQPERSSRSAEEMLDEILQLVRSIDKGTIRMALHPTTIKLQEIKRKLVSDVAVTDPDLAQALAPGILAFDPDDALRIVIPHIIPEQRLKPMREAAARLGYNVAMSQFETR